MSVLCDLHTHITASDGQYTPAELVKLAKERGLDLLAVTDHDTIAGVNEARRVGSGLGLRVKRGHVSTNPKYTPQQAFYLDQTEKYCLHRIGGSDFHGEKVKPGV